MTVTPAEIAESERQTRLRAIMQRIADALGRPVQEVIDSVTTGTYPDDTTELLRVWFTLGERDRRAAMEYVRSMAENRPPATDA